MKKITVLLILTVMVGLNEANAEEIYQQKLSALEKQQLAWAISILAQAGALQKDEKSSLQISPDLIEMLRRENLLSKDNSQISSICPDAN